MQPMSQRSPDATNPVAPPWKLQKNVFLMVDILKEESGFLKTGETTGIVTKLLPPCKRHTIQSRIMVRLEDTIVKASRTVSGT